MSTFILLRPRVWTHCRDPSSLRNCLKRKAVPRPKDMAAPVRAQVAPPPHLRWIAGARAQADPSGAPLLRVEIQTRRTPRGATLAERSRGRGEVDWAALPVRRVRGSRGGVEPAANRSGGDLKSSDPFLQPHDGYGAVVRGAAPPGHWRNAAPGRLGTWGTALRRPLVVDGPSPSGTGGCPEATVRGLPFYTFPGASGPGAHTSSPTLGHLVQPCHRTAPLPAQKGG